MSILFIALSALLIGTSLGTPSCHEVQQSHLASLHERMNHMLSTLYSSPLFSKSQGTTTTTPPTTTSPAPENPPAPSYEPSYYASYPAQPQVIYIQSQPPSLQSPILNYHGDPGVQPLEYSYTAPQSPWNYYDQYYQQYYNSPPAPPAAAYPPVPYPYPTPHHCDYTYSYPPEFSPPFRPPPYQPYTPTYPPIPSPVPPYSLPYPRPNEILPTHYA